MLHDKFRLVITFSEQIAVRHFHSEELAEFVIILSAIFIGFLNDLIKSIIGIT